jgi:hypothetical protein
MLTHRFLSASYSIVFIRGGEVDGTSGTSVGFGWLYCITCIVDPYPDPNAQLADRSECLGDASLAFRRRQSSYI